MTSYAIGEITKRVFASQAESIGGTRIVRFHQVESFGRALRWELEKSGAGAGELTATLILMRGVWEICAELSPSQRVLVGDAFEEGFGVTAVPAGWSVH